MSNLVPPYLNFQVIFIPAPPLEKHLKMVYCSPYKATNGIPRIAIFQQQPNGLRIVLGETGVYDLNGSTITLYPFSPLPENITLRDLNPTVLAVYLEWHGFLAFHASAVEKGEKAIAFMAPSGGGKSTLAAQFITAGWSLITDDILPVESSTNKVLAHPAQFQLRLTPDQARSILISLGRRTAMTVSNDGNDGKVTIHFEETEFGKLRIKATPLSRIYLLERTDDTSDPRPHITPISRSQAVIKMIMLSFAPHLAHAIGLSGDRLRRIVTLVNEVPICKLRYISRYDHFHETYNAIEQDLSTTS